MYRTKQNNAQKRHTNTPHKKHAVQQNTIQTHHAKKNNHIKTPQ